MQVVNTKQRWLSRSRCCGSENKKTEAGSEGQYKKKLAAAKADLPVLPSEVNAKMTRNNKTKYYVMQI